MAKKPFELQEDDFSIKKKDAEAKKSIVPEKKTVIQKKKPLKPNLSAAIPDELKEQLDEFCKENGVSRNMVITKLLQDFLN